MYKFPSVLIFILFLNISYSQVKIGDSHENIDGASLLELESRNKALVLTRVNSSLMQKIKPLAGALVYNTEESCVYQYNGKQWESLCAQGTKGMFLLLITEMVLF
ncbi:hypothetical protein [Maribacter halichondriae]|uniref:hypothetical protein n=1 Tax=Maribacter halichondriae TaxID=2980554 RepID=UPI00235A395A|nr:hypothetical protein [Maribacter sp. Hal144]